MTTINLSTLMHSNNSSGYSGMSGSLKPASVSFIDGSAYAGNLYFLGTPTANLNTASPLNVLANFAINPSTGSFYANNLCTYMGVSVNDNDSISHMPITYFGANANFVATGSNAATAAQMTTTAIIISASSTYEGGIMLPLINTNTTTSTCTILEVGIFTVGGLYPGFYIYPQPTERFAGAALGFGVLLPPSSATYNRFIGINGVWYQCTFLSI